jgi:hypothetical protein
MGASKIAVGFPLAPGETTTGHTATRLKQLQEAAIVILHGSLDPTFVPLVHPHRVFDPPSVAFIGCDSGG